VLVDMEQIKVSGMTSWRELYKVCVRCMAKQGAIEISGRGGNYVGMTLFIAAQLDKDGLVESMLVNQPKIMTMPDGNELVVMSIVCKPNEERVREKALYIDSMEG